MSLRESLDSRLRSAGYSERGEGVYVAGISGRTIALIDVMSQPVQWASKLDAALRLEFFRNAPTWSRYALLLVNSKKTVELGAAAAAFCREVSKCRRLVAFTDQTAEEVLPFLGLSSAVGARNTIGSDPEEITSRIFGQGSKLAASFLDLHKSVSEIQKLAEDSED
jgi:hypothetical protein